jgi:hypothetical protein
MIPLLIRKRAMERAEASFPENQAQIDSALKFLRQIEPGAAFKERLHSRIASAEVSSSVSSFPQRYGWRIAASILAVAIASGGWMLHLSHRSLATQRMPAAAAHPLPAAGVEAAGAVRVPTHATNTVGGTAGRSAHLRGAGRGTPSRHAILPRGVAVPAHPVNPADTQPPATAAQDGP